MSMEVSLQETEEREPELELRYEYTKPVELFDLGASFTAFARQFENYSYVRGYDIVEGNVTLCVTSVESGSILVRVKELWEQASLVADAADTFAGFVGNLEHIINFFRTQKSKPAALEITDADARNISRIVEPVAKDGGAVLNVTVVGNTGPVTVNTLVVTHEQANAIQNNARRFLGAEVPISGPFERELLYLDQMRGDLASKVGDRGVIEKFSPRPVKLLFMSPDVKDAILGKPENPFRMAYVVDGQVSTVKGKPALYKISAVHEAMEKP
jgi:hypothetical protein